MLEYREIARQEERRQAVGIAEIADRSRPLAGGMLCGGLPGTWMNVAVGQGFNGPVSDHELDETVAWFENAGIEPRVELTPYSDPSLMKGLSARGFVVRVFESVYFRPLDRAERVRSPFSLRDGVSIRAVDRGDQGAVAEYAHAVAAAFSMPEREATENEVEIVRRVVVHPRVLTLGAYSGGRCIGGGSMEIFEGMAGLFLLSVAEEYRRGGVQLAITAERLNAAAQSGAAFATIGARPGVATERNARRMGFQVAYTKVAVARCGPGLVAVA
jgi:hypothetical protein